MLENIYLAEYLRLSIEDGDIISNDNKAESDSINHQRLLISRYIDDNDLYPGVPVMEFVDDGYSGTNFERPAIKELLSSVREGKICCILVKDISRFGRNYLEVGDYLEQIFPFMGVRFIAINDGYDSDNYIGTTGGIEVAFRSLLYDMYSKDLSIKMNSALEIRRKRGDFIGPRPPFGYQLSSNKKVLAVDQEAAKYVRRIFELACEGSSTGQIAMRLNEEKIPTPGQYKNQNGHHYHILDGTGYWDRKKVLKILENKIYLGTVVNAKYRVTKIGAKKFERVPDEERICVPNRHEAIISEQMFEEAAQIIKNMGHQKGKKHNLVHESILQGKLRCGNCKRSLVRITCTTVPCFICERKAYDKDGGCFKGKIKEPEIERVVLAYLNQKVASNKNKPFEKLSEDSAKELQSQIIVLKRRQNSLRVEKQFLYEQLKMEQIDRNIYLEQIDSLRKKENKIDQQIEQTQAQKRSFEENIEGTECSVALESIDREVVENYIEAIYIYEIGQIDIIWKK